MSVRIKSVQVKSPAFYAGICKNDNLISINGNQIKDVLDYRFYMTDSNLLIQLETSLGEKKSIKILKEEYEDLGLEFDSYLMDNEKCCKNKCIFCFIDQMPLNMRETLYFKDDDSRLGFLFGNYITMTNLKDDDLDRIIKMHLSPINVSVHTTNPELRVDMMKNPKASEIMSQLKKLTDSGIMINVQLVLCPGINDGKELIRTFNDLRLLGDSLLSVVCVPVGLTKYRDKLPKLKSYSKDTASEVISIVDNEREKNIKSGKNALFYVADEFYIKAEKNIPDYEYYGDFNQLEDGVGLCALLKKDFIDSFEYFENIQNNRKVTIPTGKASAELIKSLASMVEERYEGIKVNVVPIENFFFGEKITVTGLLTGVDISNQLKSLDLGDEVLICDSVLRYEKDKFIDDMTINDFQQILGTTVTYVPNDGYKLLAAILGEKIEEDNVLYC